MGNLFPSLLKIPHDINSLVRMKHIHGRFEFTTMKTALTEHEKILIVFLRDFSGILSKIELCAGSTLARQLRYVSDLTPGGLIQAGLFSSNYASFSNGEKNCDSTICSPSFVCSMPFYAADTIPTILNPPTEAATISFVQYAHISIQHMEPIAQFIPEKHAISLNTSILRTFSTFREIMYAIIATERIFFSSLSLEEKYAQIYYCALARYAVEHDILSMVCKAT